MDGAYNHRKKKQDGGGRGVRSQFKLMVMHHKKSGGGALGGECQKRAVRTLGSQKKEVSSCRGKQIRHCLVERLNARGRKPRLFLVIRGNISLKTKKHWGDIIDV